MAEGNLRAARLLRVQGEWRSSISRSYYAVYAAGHAIVLHLSPGDDAPPRNLKHSTLPNIVSASIRRSLPQSTGPRAVDLRLAILKACQWRIMGDYDPGARVDGELAGFALRRAEQVISFARGVRA